MNKSLSLLIATLMCTGCSKVQNTEGAAPVKKEAALAVRAIKATQRTFESRVTIQGTLESKNVANVAARITGNIDAIYVDEGDQVEANVTKLFQLDAVTLRNTVTASEHQLAVTKASLDVAQAALGKAEAEATKAAKDFERFERLHKEGRVSDNEYELRLVQHEQAKAGMAVAEAQVSLAQSQVAQAEAALEISKKNLKDSECIAPLSGVVTLRNKEPGEQVAQGELVMRIEDPASIEAVAYLPAAYYAEVIPGKTEARLTIAGKEVGTFKVTYRSPVIHTSLRTFEIKGKVSAQEAVAGAMADMTLVFERRQALGVPSSAVLIRKEVPSLFIVKDGKASLKSVKTGLVNDGWTAVESGLEAGESIVTEGQTQLRDGMSVTLVE